MRNVVHNVVRNVVLRGRTDACIRRAVCGHGAAAGGRDPMRSTAIGSIDMGLASIANDLRATADGTAVVTGPQYLILNTVKTGDASEGRHWITVIYELVRVGVRGRSAARVCE